MEPGERMPGSVLGTEARERRGSACYSYLCALRLRDGGLKFVEPAVSDGCMEYLKDGGLFPTPSSPHHRAILHPTSNSSEMP